jgi:hypothetical protein
MVFDWFFENKKGGKYVFGQFLVELEKLEVVDEILEKLIEEEEINEEEEKEKLLKIFRELENLFKIFLAQLKKQKETLRLYVFTSAGNVDYLTEIEEVSKRLFNLFKMIDKNFDIWKLVEKGADIRVQLHLLISQLKGQMEAFYVQAKKSLEWNSHGGAKIIDWVIFKKLVRNLKGTIEPTSSGHYRVTYDLFNHVIGISQKSKKLEVAGGTFRGQIDRSFELQVIGDIKKEAKIRVKGISAEKLRDYFKAYFLLKDKFFQELFITKYKSLFKL